MRMLLVDTGVALPAHPLRVESPESEPDLTGGAAAPLLACDSAHPALTAETEIDVQVQEVEDDELCHVCGGGDDEPNNEILLCDGEECKRAYHMQCLDRCVAVLQRSVQHGHSMERLTAPLPAGKWFCPACDPWGKAAQPAVAQWTPADEHRMEFKEGMNLLALDKHGLWAKAVVLETEITPQDDNDGDGSLAMKMSSRVKVHFKGFSCKCDEYINVGKGRLRPVEVGMPEEDEELYIIDQVHEVRRSKGRNEYLTSWVGYEELTWEPARNFCGSEAKKKLREFTQRQNGQSSASPRNSPGVYGPRGEVELMACNTNSATSSNESRTTEPATQNPVDEGLNGDGHEQGDDGASNTRKAPPLEYPNPVMLPKVQPLPPSGTWVFLKSNHPVADRALDYVPLTGVDGGMGEGGDVTDDEVSSDDGRSVDNVEPRSKGMVPLRLDSDASDADSTSEDPLDIEHRSIISEWPTSEASADGPAPLDEGALGNPPTLQSLFCRRCFTYDCSQHGVNQPLPAWRFRDTIPESGRGQDSEGNRSITCSCSLSRRFPMPSGDPRRMAESLVPFPEVRRTGNMKRALTALDLRIRKKRQIAKGAFRIFPTAACSHSGPCDSSNPACTCIHSANFCEVFCSCGPLCRNRWTGCKCRKECRTAVCPCWVANRECDPDICVCTASDARACGCEECMPVAEASEKINTTAALESIENPRQRDSLACLPCDPPDPIDEGRKEDDYDHFRPERTSVRIIESAPDGEDAHLSSDETSENPCRMTCRNMDVTLQRNEQLLLGPSGISGWGIFSQRAIKARELVSEYVGELISQEEAEHRGRVYDARACSYLFNLNQTQVTCPWLSALLTLFAAWLLLVSPFKNWLGARERHPPFPASICLQRARRGMIKMGNARPL
eukprot:scaffold107884_cov29-Tisochrysis_lutea.AAC.2